MRLCEMMREGEGKLERQGKVLGEEPEAQRWLPGFRPDRVPAVSAGRETIEWPSATKGGDRCLEYREEWKPIPWVQLTIYCILLSVYPKVKQILHHSMNDEQ
ncbi:MAG: hypothetical protein LBR80_08875 [Deltaproteobacteria bacterium]|jgi:hypothetical protein|nr:hypothetical protein [Deltaproteobacteria bacterium]